MNNTVEISGREVILESAIAKFKNHGCYQIKIELLYNEEKKSFSEITTSMSDLDEIREIEDLKERELALYELIQYKLESKLEEWIREADSFFYIEGWRNGNVVGVINTDGKLNSLENMDLSNYMSFESEEDAEWYITNVLKRDVDVEDENGFCYSIAESY
ncbi:MULTISPECIES: hypothetical protein [Weeksellaceae]|uniref:hypothetical protein n=1 Tax=Weeksellaceae TaxID=2762318 RepID=UPI0021F857AD|nr:MULTISPECIES: hypothetical protein [Weeksellaceae]MCW0518315.1 hypothetical protein [Riemerella anatipestifer]MEC5393947.1 hypothetical protein [Bergeyella sp. RCAD1439]